MNASSQSQAPPPSIASFGVPAPRAVGLPRGWTTPKTLKVFRGGVCALVALLFLFGESTLSQSRAAFKTIGKDTVPSIIAAEEIGYALADLDANVANSLLGNAQHRQIATAAIEKQRIKVTDSLVDAAQNITYGDAEKIPIRMMTRDFGLYLERAAEARLRFEQGDEAGARTSYWVATDLLHTKLLVEAADLDAANKVQLDAAYRDGGQETRGAEAIAISLGTLLVFGMFLLQLFLTKKTRRILNAPLVIATLMALVFPVYLALRFSDARDSLRIAKEDAFDSIHAIVRARTLAYDANGDESRYLLDMSAARGMDDAFRKKVAALSSQPTATVPSQRELADRKRKGQTGGATGLFWDELKNVTFDGEYASASRMMQAFRDYMLIDGRIRKFASSGKMPDAIELCIGDKPDESNAAFDRFDAALGSTLEINRTAFDHEIDHTTSDLGTARAVSIFLSVGIVVLTWLGLRMRLREYTA
jgi:hypothetical protein